MDITQLHRFLVAAETGNLRRAAARLHISQPALTQSIKSLEQALGVAVFDRSGKGVTLNDYGRALVPHARMILSERDRISTDLGEITHRTGSRLTVGVAPYFSRRLFPEAVTQFLKEFPTARIEIVEEHSDDLAELLVEGRIDLAFCVISPRIEGNDALETIDTLAERYSVVARAKHPLFTRGRTTEKDLATYPWVVYDMQRTPQMYTEIFREHGVAAPACPVSTLSLPLMAALVAHSDFLALMPEDFVWPEIAASRLRRLTGHAINVTGRGGLVLRKGASRSPALKALVRKIRSVCDESRQKSRRTSTKEARDMGE